MLKNRIQNKIVRELVELLIALVIAGAAFLLLYNFVARTGLVNGLSMEPTLSHNDLVFINKTAYWFREPVMGDIVAFPDPENIERHLIKRVIGVYGDVVDYIDGSVYLNGELLPYEFRMEAGGGYSVVFPLTVEENRVFVLGDNRWASRDSRYQGVGNIEVANIIGRVPFRLFPFAEFGLLR